MDHRPGAALSAWVAVAVAIVAAAGCTAHGSTTRRPTPPGSTTSAPAAAKPTSGANTAATTPATVLGADQAIVAGVLGTVHVVDAVAGPLAMPVLVTIPERGQGRLEIEGVTANGHRASTIAWDGGQPLPLSGSGTLDLTPATVDADAGGLTWHLDGAARSLTAGQYTAGSPVAVGSSGLASPQDRATFSVAAGFVGQVVTAGDARIHEPPRHIDLTGPGRITLTGTITVRTRAGARTVHQIAFGPGPFQLTLDPAAGGYGVGGLLQGPMSFT